MTFYKKIILSFILILFIICGVVFGTIAKEVEYNSKIGKSEITEITGIPENNFEVANSYCRKSNSDSSNPFKFYKKLLVLNLNINDLNETETRNFLASFSICQKNDTMMEMLSDTTDTEKSKWMSELNSDNLIWHSRTQQFEDENIKSSVELYLISSENSNTVYLILDQTDI